MVWFLPVFIELIFTRILFLIAFISILIITTLTVLVIKLFTDLAIPGWTATGVLTLAILSYTIIMVSAFMVLNSRSTKLFIPAKDSKDFMREFKY